MLVFGVVVYVLLGLMVVLVSSLYINVDHHEFELDKRARAKDSQAKTLLERNQIFYSLIDLKQIIVSVLVVGFVAVGIARFGWTAGVMVSIFLVALSQVLARIKWVGRLSGAMYEKHESWFIKTAQLIDKYAAFVGVVHHRKLDKFQIQSTDELLNLVQHARGVSAKYKLSIEAQLSIGETQVKDYMVKADKIDFISYNELLGPLVLDDLHKTGHRWFPVIREKLENTVGFLDSRDVLTIDSKRSVKAHTAMQHEVVKIHQDDSLDTALDISLKTGSWIMLVIDSDKQVVGLIGLPDIMKYMRGEES